MDCMFRGSILVLWFVAHQLHIPRTATFTRESVSYACAGTKSAGRRSVVVVNFQAT